MTIATTTAHADWSSHAEDSSVDLRFEANGAVAQPPLASEDEDFVQRVQRLMQLTPPKGDPMARNRIAAALYRATGWEVFAEDERAYVSRLWAEDWDSPEDAAYDDE